MTEYLTDLVGKRLAFGLLSDTTAIGAGENRLSQISSSSCSFGVRQTNWKQQIESQRIGNKRNQTGFAKKAWTSKKRADKRT